MIKKSYVAPVMTEFELNSVQSFLQASAGMTMDFGTDNYAGAGMSESDWGEF